MAIKRNNSDGISQMVLRIELSNVTLASNLNKALNAIRHRIPYEFIMSQDISQPARLKSSLTKSQTMRKTNVLKKNPIIILLTIFSQLRFVPSIVRHAPLTDFSMNFTRSVAVISYFGSQFVTTYSWAQPLHGKCQQAAKRFPVQQFFSDTEATLIV